MTINLLECEKSGAMHLGHSALEPGGETATNLTEEFGKQLRGHRIRVGLTQEELAERSRLSIRAIADMERGRTIRPYRGSVGRLADALMLAGPDREALERAARQSPRIAGTPRLHAVADRPARRLAQIPDRVTEPRHLPPAIPHFVGRSAELSALTGVLPGPSPAGGAVPVAAIVGPAGVGKTALAVHWAHQVARRFPDGQLYLNLRGFDQDADPLTPSDAMHSMLAALGVPPAVIPASLGAQAGLYRSLLADRRMLIVLDNAAGPAQARPLLPANAACLVVVTSRDQLAGLVAEGARSVFLDVLTETEALDLLSFMLGPDRFAADPQSAAEVCTLCARLPVALTAAIAASCPQLTLAELAGELRSAGRRLDAMDTGEAATSVRAVLSASYQRLSQPTARMFRLLGIYPGPDISADAAARAAGISAQQASALLHELARAHLVTRRGQGRFALHDDILRAFAAEQADDAKQATADDTGADLRSGRRPQPAPAARRRADCADRPATRRA
jgi:transcriptional regulator with XRE-family HTH domain